MKRAIDVLDEIVSAPFEFIGFVGTLVEMVQLAESPDEVAEEHVAVTVVAVVGEYVIVAVAVPPEVVDEEDVMMDDTVVSVGAVFPAKYLSLQPTHCEEQADPKQAPSVIP